MQIYLKIGRSKMKFKSKRYECWIPTFTLLWPHCPHGFEQVEIQLIFSKSWHPWTLDINIKSLNNREMKDARILPTWVAKVLPEHWRLDNGHLCICICIWVYMSCCWCLYFFKVQNASGPHVLPASFEEIMYDLNQFTQQISSMVLFRNVTFCRWSWRRKR